MLNAPLRVIVILGALLALTGPATARFAERGRPPRAPAPLAFPWPLSETTWLGGAVDPNRRFRLAPPPTLNVIGRYQRPWENHTPEWRRFFEGPYGFGRVPAPSLTWRLSEDLEPLPLPVVVSRPCPRWKAPRPLAVARAAETEYLALFDCDGAIAPEVIDRLSVLARAPDAPRPTLPLPEAPTGDLYPGEWLPGVRLLDPRLVWVLGEIQEAFPGRSVVIMSGYRPHAHTSYHQRGKALDLYVQGVANEDLFGLCRTLRDVGCGYYPNNSFVHIDVRGYGSAKAMWVDVSDPGTPSKYVDGWPGVLEPGAGWLGAQGGN